MNIQEIVKKIVEYINTGKNVQAEEELYADDVLSVEQNGHSVKGKEAVIQKTKGAFAEVEEVFSGGVDQAFVSADNFLLIMNMDMKRKGGERMKSTEYGFYKVKDGKISEEYFFSQPMAE